MRCQSSSDATQHTHALMATHKDRTIPPKLPHTQQHKSHRHTLAGLLTALQAHRPPVSTHPSQHPDVSGTDSRCLQVAAAITPTMPCDHEHGGTLHSPAGTYRPLVPTQPSQHPDVSGSSRIAAARSAIMPGQLQAHGNPTQPSSLHTALQSPHRAIHTTRPPHVKGSGRL